MTPLRVLITSLTMWPPSGTTLYVRDLALELQRRGHYPMVFSTTRGPLASQLRTAGIPLTDRLRDLEAPDVIHAHQRALSLAAMEQWPSVPAIYVCRDRASPLDEPPLHPSVRRYFGVSRACVKRVVQAGVPEDQVTVLPNSIDTAPFGPRDPLPQSPRRAAVYSTYADGRASVPTIMAACEEAGIGVVEVIGTGADTVVSDPERLLPEYDLVFAKGRAAMQAMAAGCAVVLCDFGRIGSMVTSAEFDALHQLNFGLDSLREPIGGASLAREIARYDPNDAARVGNLIKSRASLGASAERLIGIYRDVASERWARSATSAGRRTRVRHALLIRLYRTWHLLPIGLREAFRNLPGVRAALGALKRLG